MFGRIPTILREEAWLRGREFPPDQLWVQVLRNKYKCLEGFPPSLERRHASGYGRELAWFGQRFFLVSSGKWAMVLRLISGMMRGLGILALSSTVLLIMLR
ncbi:hypothetical protein V6N13_139275 [Hibiscus sabdariffa]